MNNKIKLVGAVVFMLLIAMGFFSNTIYMYNTPSVTAVLPVSGRLQKRETSTGIADWADIEELYTEVAGRVDELYAAEGDAVTEGQELARLSFETEDLQARLQALALDREKMLLAAETTTMRVNRLWSEISELQAEVYQPEEVSDRELAALQTKITEAEEGLYGLERLFEVGGVTQQELDAARQALDALRLDYDNLILTRDKNIENAQRGVEEREKARAKAISDKQYEINTLGQDAKARELDLRQNDNDRAAIEAQLSLYDNSALIYAPADGVIVSLELKRGQSVSKNQLAASIGVGSTFIIECEISSRNNFTVTGDECRLSNTDHRFTANITKITPTADAKEVTVRIESDEITAGETFDLEFTKESADSAVLVPSGAVNRDSTSYFVYRIGERKGVLGDEYFAEKLRVEIGDSDGTNTVITKGIMFFEPIVLTSDKPFNEGATLSVKNEGDFFVN
jgi:multidrug efflux pump subunit AcrA (membrane-fusion protein)